MEHRILIAGFGGQGVLFAGKYLAQVGLLQDKEVSWLPSYGPEMRGGTANCGVVISDRPIGTPIVSKPEILICMNAPSLDKFVNEVTEGGMIFIDSSLIERKVERHDVGVFTIPATRLADDIGMKNLANMVIIGKMIKESGLCPEELIHSAMKETVSEKKKDLFAGNMKAIMMGYEYAGEL